jgi:hypothetical protein
MRRSSLPVIHSLPAMGGNWAAGRTFAVGLVTSDAMTFSVEDLGAFGEDDLVGSF